VGAVAAVLASAREVIAVLAFYRYTFTGGDTSDKQGEGAWALSSSHEISTIVAICSSPAPDGPKQTDSNLIPVDEAVGENGQAYAGPFDADEGPLGSQVPRFSVGFIDDTPSPAAWVLVIVDAAERLTLIEEVVDNRPVYKLAGAAVELLVDRAMFRPLDFVGSSGVGTWHWVFIDFDLGILIMP
jgi:hypothetical protein